MASKAACRALVLLSIVSLVDATAVCAEPAKNNNAPSAPALGLCRCVAPLGEDELQRLFLQRCTASEEDCRKMPCDVPNVRTWEANASDCAARKGARRGGAPPHQYDPMMDFH